MPVTSRRGADARTARIAVVVSGWPRLSEVFAHNELLALQRAGMLVGVFATKHGETGPRQPGVTALDSLVEVLPDGGVDAQARALVERLSGSGVSAVHGYFAHRPAAVAAAAAPQLGVPYGFSVHALDARRVPRLEMAERANGAAVVVCCNDDVAAHVAVTGRHPVLLRHGVDLKQFTATDAPGRRPMSLLAVGRLVEKKGFTVLLDALALVDRPVHLCLVGAGPQRAQLESAVATREMHDRVTLLGRRTHADLPTYYTGADVVVVPSIVDRGGDRDGLPNVVLEAMASARPVVASDVAAIPSAVRDGVTGLLVPPRDPWALADALTELVDNPVLRAAHGRAGRKVAEQDFALADCTASFCATLERVYG